MNKLDKKEEEEELELEEFFEEAKEYCIGWKNE